MAVALDEVDFTADEERLSLIDEEFTVTFFKPSRAGEPFVVNLSSETLGDGKNFYLGEDASSEKAVALAAQKLFQMAARLMRLRTELLDEDTSSALEFEALFSGSTNKFYANSDS